jgi:hypothetical protein
MTPSICVNGCEGKLAREGYDTCSGCASMEEKRAKRKIKREAVIDLEEDDTVQEVVRETLEKRRRLETQKLINLHREESAKLDFEYAQELYVFFF